MARALEPMEAGILGPEWNAGADVVLVLYFVRCEKIYGIYTHLPNVFSCKFYVNSLFVL